jgi:hypothetical protein
MQQHGYGGKNGQSTHKSGGRVFIPVTTPLAAGRRGRPCRAFPEQPDTLQGIGRAPDLSERKICRFTDIQQGVRAIGKIQHP